MALAAERAAQERAAEVEQAMEQLTEKTRYLVPYEPPEWSATDTWQLQTGGTARALLYDTLNIWLHLAERGANSNTLFPVS